MRFFQCARYSYAKSQYLQCYSYSTKYIIIARSIHQEKILSVIITVINRFVLPEEHVFLSENRLLHTYRFDFE